MAGIAKRFPHTSAGDPRRPVGKMSYPWYVVTQEYQRRLYLKYGGKMKKDSAVQWIEVNVEKIIKDCGGDIGPTSRHRTALHIFNGLSHMHFDVILKEYLRDCMERNLVVAVCDVCKEPLSASDFAEIYSGMVAHVSCLEAGVIKFMGLSNEDLQDLTHPDKL